jgi:hypothetical protein
MLPHRPPTLFAVSPDGSVLLPETHPLATEGGYPSAALVELAAQLAGLQVQAPPGHGGMLVDVRDLLLEVPSVPPGTLLFPEIKVERATPPMPRIQVRLPGVLSVTLLLWVRP